MLRGGVTRFTAIAVGACGALVAFETAEAFGAHVPRTLVLLAASACAVLAATVALRHVAFIWRGPVIVAFRRPEGRLCDSREAEAVRSAAQLRGTMGGAGHLHPRRLAFSAVAWGAASAQCVALVVPDHRPTSFAPLAVLVLASGLAVIFPPDPFYYREAAGGCVVVFPVDACVRVLRAAGARALPTPVLIGAAMPVLAPSESSAGTEPDGARSKDADEAEA